MKTIAALVLYVCVLQVFWTANAQALNCANDRIALATPKTYDPLYSEELLRVAQREILLRQKLDCPQIFIKYDKTVEVFDLLGINAYFSTAPEHLSSRKLGILKERTKATHVLFAALSKDQQNLQIVLFRIDSIADSELILNSVTSLNYQLSEEKVPLTKSNSTFAHLAITTPNAMTIGTTYTEVSFDMRRGFKEDNTEVRGILPPIISSMSLSKIEHPYSYDLLDFKGSLFPGLYLFSINQVTTASRYKDKLNEERHHIHIRAHGGCTNLNATGSLHTPIGTSYTALGYGPCLMQTKRDHEAKDWVVDLAVRFQVGHRAFITTNIFSFFEIDMLSFGRKFYSSEAATARTIYRGTLGIGWYAPDVERSLLRLF